MVESTALVGMKMICEYVRRSESTVLKLIREEEFPAEKVCGIWESDILLVDEWRREKIKFKKTMSTVKTGVHP